MPSAEELEQMLDVEFVVGMRMDAREHGWTPDEYARMLKMEVSKANDKERYVDC